MNNWRKNRTDRYPKGLWWEALYFSAFTSSLTKYFGKISWDFLFLIKELTILFLAHQRMGNIHRFKESYPEIKVSYPEIRVLYCLKILKITVIWPFQSQLIIEIYHFDANMMTHLDFCDPTVKFFLDPPKNCIEILNLTIWWVWVGGFFQVTPSNFPLFVSFKGILSKFSYVKPNSYYRLFCEL